MKTSTAIVSHIGLGGAQVGAVLAGAQAGLPWWAQLLIQLGFSAFQGWVAHVNSNSDPQGKPLLPSTK